MKRYNLLVIEDATDKIVFDRWYENQVRELWDMVENIAQGLCEGYKILVVDEDNDILIERTIFYL